MSGAAGRLAGIGLICLFHASSAEAAFEWATWVVHDATSATGTIGDGRSALFTGHPGGFEPAGTFAVADPTIPGEPSGGNPNALGALTGSAPAPALIPLGGLLMSLDLGNFAVDEETTFAMSDQQDTRTYRLEFLDASLNPLSMTAIEVTNYNFALLPQPNFVADHDLIFDAVTGRLTVSPIHDANPPGTYRHSGFTMFNNFPPGTRYIRLLDATTLEYNREGLKFYLGNTPVPEPTLATLQFAALASIALIRMRRRRGGV